MMNLLKTKHPNFNTNIIKALTSYSDVLLFSKVRIVRERSLMTRNQIDYAISLETKRHNAANEAVARENLREQVRHNVASESLSHESNVVSRKNAKTAAKAQKYSARTSASASKYSADKHAEASKYSANLSYQANLDNIEMNKFLDMYGTKAKAALISAQAAAKQAVTAQDRVAIDWQNARTNQTKAEAEKQNVLDQKEVRNTQAALNRATKALQDGNLNKVKKETENAERYWKLALARLQTDQVVYKNKIQTDWMNSISNLIGSLGRFGQGMKAGTEAVQSSNQWITNDGGISYVKK